MRDTRQQAQHEPQYEQKNQSSYWKNYEKEKKKKVDPVLSDDVINMKEVTDVLFSKSGALLLFFERKS